MTRAATPGHRRTGMLPLLLALAGAALPAATSANAVSTFARERAHDVHALLLGPVAPQPPAVGEGDCATLYARRLALLREDLDHRPSFWRDPRHAAAVFTGAVWTPAFYYLPYRAVSAVAAEGRDARRAAELDALRMASAEARCFER
ncbi:MAG: hypothetical protein RLW62_04105 [Gammaproteobacteria bacterium]